MKKLIYIILFFFITLLNANAAGSWSQNFGLNYSFVSKSDNKLTPGFIYGLENGRQLNSKFRLITGASLFIDKGKLIDETIDPKHTVDDPQISIYTLNISYLLAEIAIPVIAKYKFISTENYNIYLAAGP